MVKLNIGGTTFCTSYETLSQSLLIGDFDSPQYIYNFERNSFEDDLHQEKHYFQILMEGKFRTTYIEEDYVSTPKQATSPSTLPSEDEELYLDELIDYCHCGQPITLQNETCDEPPVINVPRKDLLEINSKYRTRILGRKHHSLGSVLSSSLGTTVSFAKRRNQHMLSLGSDEERVFSIFVDRDGRHFHYILNYLRERGDVRRVKFPFDKPDIIEELIIEAQFYNLNHLVYYLRYEQFVDTNFGGSDILTRDFKRYLIDWYCEDCEAELFKTTEEATATNTPTKEEQSKKQVQTPRNRQWEIIYKASKDGFRASDFHEKCDNACETIMVIKSQNNSIFGGYCPETFETKEGYKFNEKTWLFSLKNPSNYGPVKMRHYQKFQHDFNKKSWVTNKPNSNCCFGVGDICK